MNQYLMTGASGFIGRDILKTLVKNNCSVLTIGRSSCELSSSHLNADLSNVKSNLFSELKQLTQNDVLIHCAGLAHVAGSDTDEMHDKVNYQGTKALLEELEKSGHSPSIVFISTVAVYGEMKGENAPGNLASMIDALKRGRFLLIGGGQAKRSWVDVNDVGEFILSNKELTGIFNFTSGEDLTIEEIASCISTATKSRLPYNIPKALGYLLGKAGDFLGFFGINPPVNSEKIEKLTYSLTFSNSKILSTTNWSPQNDFSKALKETV